MTVAEMTRRVDELLELLRVARATVGSAGVRHLNALDRELAQLSLDLRTLPLEPPVSAHKGTG